MARVPKARYTREFKVHAVSMAKDEGLGVAETARRLSISPKTVANWVKLAQEGRNFAKQSATSGIDAENGRLRKENAYQERMAQYRMVCSMSRKGDCYDNAPDGKLPGSAENRACPPKALQQPCRSHP